MSQVELSPLTLDDCWRVMDEDVFRLQKSEYYIKHPIWPGSVGIEIEMMVWAPESSWSSKGEPAVVELYPARQTSPALTHWIEALAKENGWDCDYASDGEGSKLMGVKLDHEDQLTFEPGGQLEFSSRPYPCLSDAFKRKDQILNTLGRFLSGHGMRLFHHGINPWQSVSEIGLQMQKPRYQAMDRYFRTISPYGASMMRQTCTVQVNLDFGSDESTLARRYLGAHLIAPYLTGMFANSPFVEGKYSGYQSFRSLCWRHLDPSRTGTRGLDGVVSKMNKASCVENYLDFLLDAKVVFVTGLQYENPEKDLTFRQWMEQGYKGFFPSLEDWKTHMSLHFPEVRARGFMELRSVDAQSRLWQNVPMAVYCALIYDDKLLSQVIETFGASHRQLESLLLQGAHGLREEAIAKGAKQLMQWTEEGFTRLPPCFHGKEILKQVACFGEQFTYRGLTPADALRMAAEKDGGKISPDTFYQLDEGWFQLLQ